MAITTIASTRKELKPAERDEQERFALTKQGKVRLVRAFRRWPAPAIPNKFLPRFCFISAAFFDSPGTTEYLISFAMACRFEARHKNGS